jgi:hypothetical protein
MTYWRRNSLVTYDLLSGFSWEDAIGAGNTYLRYHIRWGWQLDCPVDVDVQTLSTGLIYFGLVTTVGDGTEVPPGARTDAWPDIDPPMQRWVYWECTAPVVELVSVEAGYMIWRGAASTEVTSSKGQVANTGTPEGETLNLFTSWDCAEDIVALSGGNFMHWHSISILRKNGL